jgi:hypothetical protein
MYHTKVLQIIEEWNLSARFVGEAIEITTQSVRNKISKSDPKNVFTKQNLYKLESYIIQKAKNLEERSEFFGSK